MRVLSALFLLVTFATGDKVLHLTDKNFDSEVIKSGKGSIVKFFAPWCGHCKALRPTWDKLADKWANDDSVNVADVDCTVEDSLCSKFEVRGYPTLKYWSAEGEGPLEYQGGRDLNDLDSFIQKTLAVLCSLSNQSSCSEKEKTYIAKWNPKNADDKDAKDKAKKELKRLEGMKSGAMTPDKKSWLNARVGILKKIVFGEKKNDDDLDDDDDEL